MTRGRVLLLTIVAVLALFAIGGAVLLGRASPTATVITSTDTASVLAPITPEAIAAAPAAQVSRWRAALAACPEDEGSGFSGPSCSGDAWWKALQSAQLPAFYQGMEQLNQERSTRRSLCHTVGHATGRRAFETYKDAATLMKMTAPGSMSCDNGFLHGVLDAFSQTSPSPAELTKVIDACYSFADPSLHNACVDGFGHASWLASSDPVKAGKWCVQLRQEHDISICVTGIVMQSLRVGYNEEPAAIRPEEAQEKLPPLCDAIEAGVNPGEEPVKLCYREISTAFTTLISPMTWAWVQGPNQDYKQKPTWDQMEAGWRDAIGKCASLPKYNDLCVRGVAEAVVWVALGDRATIEKICPLFPGEQDRSRCLAAYRDET